MISLVDARTALGVSEATLARAIRRGEICVIRVGGRTLIDESDLIAFIAARKQRGPDHSPLPMNDDGPVDAEPLVEGGADADSSRDSTPA